MYNRRGSLFFSCQYFYYGLMGICSGWTLEWWFSRGYTSFSIPCFVVFRQMPSRLFCAPYSSVHIIVSIVSVVFSFYLLLFSQHSYRCLDPHGRRVGGAVAIFHLRGVTEAVAAGMFWSYSDPSFLPWRPLSFTFGYEWAYFSANLVFPPLLDGLNGGLRQR